MEQRRRRWMWRAVAAIAILGIAIQFVPFGVDNPAARDEPAWDQPRTRELFFRACASCHSNETEVLWFEHVAPIKWYIANHVREGREALNVSEWSTKPGDDADDMAEVVRDGDMPLSSYTAFGLHSEGRLSESELQDLIDGMEAMLVADPPAGR